MMSTLRREMMAPPPVCTLPQALFRLAGSFSLDASMDGGWLTVHTGGRSQSYGARELLHLALRWTAALQAAGMQPGDRVAILMPNSADFVAVFFGIQLGGGIAVPLAWPVSLLDLRRNLEMLEPLVENAGARLLATSTSVANIGAFGLPAVVAPALQPSGTLQISAPEDIAFFQYTSGSLGRPRGVMISQQAAVASAWAMTQALGLGVGDVGVSWLPLFHDMGLVGGLLCPLLGAFPLHLMTPGEFLLHPVRWLRLISEVRGAIAAAPDFAYALATRRVRAEESGLDLRCWRHALSGSEPVHRSTLDGFATHFAASGFSAQSFRPVYGLAENTLGVSFGDPGDPDLQLGERRVVSVGRPLPGMELSLSSGGEVLVRGPALMAGYWQDPQATAAALREGWLHTGDLGAIQEGRLYLTGREKDLVIQHGRKFHPYDIERVAAATVEALPNAAAAFATAEEALVVVLEVAAAQQDVERRVRGELLAALGVRPERVIQVEPGALPRTTSGKVRRAACAERYA